MNKKLLILFLAISVSIITTSAILLLNQPSEVRADSDDNISGWAYSENIGWISFNNTTGGGPIDYGVHICSTSDANTFCSGKSEGTLVGYAWSRGTDTDVGGVGWISFNESDLGGCPQIPCKAWVDTSDGKVYGWAKALAGGTPEAGGWNGWIKLNGTAIDGSTYNVKIDADDGEFHGWAWGDNVMGWISFNCDNPETVCSHDYKVETNFSFSSPPKVENMQILYHDCCGTTKNTCRIGFDWVYSDVDGDPETKIEFQIDNNAGFANPEVNRTFEGLSNPNGTHNTQIVYVVSSATADKLIFRGTSSTKYYWRVRVYDDSGNNSGWIEPSLKSFQTETHAWPWPDFELTPSNPAVEEIASTTNSSNCFDNSQSEIQCSSSAWLWSVPEGDFVNGTTNTDKEPFIQFSSAGNNKEVILRVYDSSLGVGEYCSKTKTFDIKLPLPIWIETGAD